MKQDPFQPLYGAKSSTPKPQQTPSPPPKKENVEKGIDLDQIRQDLLKTQIGLKHIYNQVKKNNTTLANFDIEFLSKNKLILIALLILVAIIVIIVYMQKKQKTKLAMLAEKMQKLQALKG